MDDKISAMTAATSRANKRIRRRSRLAMNASMQALMLLEAPTPPVEVANSVPLLTPSQLSYSLLRGVGTDGDSIMYPGGSIVFPGSLDPPSDMAVVFSQVSVDSPMKGMGGVGVEGVTMAAVPLSGIKGRIARVLLKNTQAGNALVSQFGCYASPSHALPIASYGTPGKRNIPVASASQLQKRYEEAKAYLDKKDLVESNKAVSTQFLPNIAATKAEEGE